MNVRTKFLALAIAAAAIPTAYASSGATFVGGELGFQTHPPTSGLTRAQVRQESAAFRAHPVLADGTVAVGGELGYVGAVEGAFADRDPAGPHTHAKAHAQGAAAAAPMTEAELRAYRQQYIN